MAQTDTAPMNVEAEDSSASLLLRQIVERLPSQGKTEGPLYSRLARTILGMIESGELRGGESLPSERDLATATGYSRMTVRNAINELMSDGLVSKKRGAGTYVSKQIEQPLSVLMGFTADMQRRGASSSSIELDKSIGLPAPDEILKLALSPNEQVVRLSRVRTSEGEPLAIEHAVVPLSAVKPDDIGASLYDAMRANGNMPVRALQRLRAALASPEEAKYLGVPKGASILHIERWSFLENGKCIELTKSSYRGDRYDFIAELKIDS
jgi:GntR family transcriptional regulator